MLTYLIMLAGSSNRWIYIVISFSVVGVISMTLIVIVIIRRKYKPTITDDASNLQELSKFVYISYAEDSPNHLSRVQSMASHLSQSFNCHLYEEFRNQAANMFVHNWLSQQISQATAIVIVCSPKYQRITEDMQQNCDGLCLQNGSDFINWEQRVRYEWNLIQSRGFSQQQNLSFCITVLWDGSDEWEKPFPLATNKCYYWPREMSGLRKCLENEGLKCDSMIEI